LSGPFERAEVLLPEEFSAFENYTETLSVWQERWARRSDARRNRERLVEAAREVFREQGYDASLDEVAKRAGVGAGTLYRHFPSRDVLMDAMMQSWVDRVNDAADKVLVHEGDPRDLLLTWFETYVGLISMHKGGPAKITSAMGDENSPIITKCQVLVAATQRVVDRLEEDHALREHIDVVQMCRLVGGVATVADNGNLDQAAVRPLLEVIADGMLV
jgi:AcrR family transcriptional regulator